MTDAETNIETDEDDDFYQEDDDGGASGESGTDADPGWVALPSGEALTEVELDELMRWKSVSLVALVGERGSGKTTFISSLFERFMRGAFSGRLFAGSWTLVGLDQRSFEARAESGRETPDTVRTSRQEGLRFLHLSTAPAAGGGQDHHLVLSDRSGESYTDVRNNKANAAALQEIGKAQRVVLLLDGARFAQPRLRAEAIASVRGLMRALVEAGTLGPSSAIDVVTTKLDLVVAAGSEKALGDAEAAIGRQFEGQVASLKFWKVAARDPTGNLEAATGVAGLFKDWLEKPKVTMRKVARPEPETALDRLLLSTDIAELYS